MQAMTVLVIEDEPLIRMTVADDLVGAGFVVLEAGNADEALRVLEDQPHVSAIFTDIDMPGKINGLGLAWIVSDRWPPIRIVITSGHRKLEPADMPEQSIFFPKPYAHKPVIEALRRLLK